MKYAKKVSKKLTVSFGFVKELQQMMAGLYLASIVFK